MEVGRWRMLLMLLDRLLRRQAHRRTRQLRSLGRLRGLLWWCMVGVRARLVVLLRMQRRLLVDRLVHRLVRLLQLRSMAMRGTRASTRLLRKVLWVLGLCMVGEWARMRVLWVRRLLRQEEHLVRELRRQLVVLGRQVRARQMQRRLLGWRLVLWWLRMEALCRMWLGQLVRLLRRLVRGRMRLLEWLGRLLVRLCWVVGAVWRLQRRLRGMLLVRQVDLWVHKGRQLVLWWSEVEDRLRRLVRRHAMQ
jgi:hypothetical protein